MKKEYDFSKAQRGKFFRKNVKMSIPVYLSGETLPFVHQIARLRRTDVSSVVNALIKEDMRLAEILR